MQPPKYTKNILSGLRTNSNNAYYYQNQYRNSKNGLCQYSKAQYSQSAGEGSRFRTGSGSGAIILHSIEISIHNNAPPS